jgi:hypothetical protein
MQIRDGMFNVFFYGGRLLQQWIVDMYIKIESMRLDWYSNPDHQKIIRADLYQVSVNCKLQVSYAVTRKYQKMCDFILIYGVMSFHMVS